MKGLLWKAYINHEMGLWTGCQVFPGLQYSDNDKNADGDKNKAHDFVDKANGLAGKYFLQEAGKVAFHKVGRESGWE